MVAIGHITPAPLQIRLRILTAGKSGHAQVVPPKYLFLWGGIWVLYPFIDFLVSSAPKSPHPNNVFLFCRAHICDQQTEKQTDHTTCVTTNHILYYALRCGLNTLSTLCHF